MVDTNHVISDDPAEKKELYDAIIIDGMLRTDILLWLWRCLNQTPNLKAHAETKYVIDRIAKKIKETVTA